ncbi:MAG: SHOCT domain-containing protein [Rubrobacteraceae bacterium]|nr:SHOCT domain-containing protein [Rubrobacteraceae bacterium]
MMQNMVGGFGWLWMLVPLLLWGGLLLLIAWLLIRLFPGRSDGGPGTREDDAEEILRKRFARGELDADEYERSVEVLKGERSSTRGGL